MNYYDILGVPQTATQDTIKSAYRQKCQIYHPDKNPSEHAHIEFLQVKAAYEKLSNVRERQEYDHLLKTFSGKSPTPAPTPSPAPAAKPSPTPVPTPAPSPRAKAASPPPAAPQKQKKEAQLSTMPGSNIETRLFLTMLIVICGVGLMYCYFHSNNFFSLGRNALFWFTWTIMLAGVFGKDSRKTTMEHKAWGIVGFLLFIAYIIFSAPVTPH